MQAITTKFCGYRFRSRLEARWAVFFDALGLNWTYEPEGFNLDGDWYLPDFWIEDWQAWVEIKPKLVASPTFNSNGESKQNGDSAWVLCNRLAEVSRQKVLLIQSQPWIDFTEDENCVYRLNGYRLNPDRVKYDISAFLHTPPQFNCKEESVYPTWRHRGWMIGMLENENFWLCHECWPGVYDLKSHAGSDIVDSASVNIDIDPLAGPLLQAFTAARSARFEHGEQGYWAP